VTSRRLSFATKVAYGIGQLAEGVKTTAFTVFLLFYYNQVLGLAAWWTGLALGVATVVDAVSDPLMGSISDSARHRWGRRHPFIYASALPLGVFLALLFRPPAGLADGWLFAWLIGFTLLARLAVTVFAVPHLALGAELSTDYRERTSVVAHRAFFAYVGAVAVVVAGWGFFFRSEPGLTDGQFNRAAYPPFGVFCAIVATLSVLVSAVGTHGRISHLLVPRTAPEPLSAGRLWSEMRDTLANASFRALFFGIVLFFVTRGVADGLGIYMFTHFWEIPPRAILQVQAIGLIGVLVGTVLWVALSRRIEKRPAFLVGISVYSLFTLLPPLAKLCGLFPAAGHPLYVASLTGLAFIAALGAAAALVTSGSMMADIADEHELDTGRRQEGIFFGALTFAVKVTSGLGQFVAGWGLELIAFPLRAVPGTVPPGTVRALAILYGPGLAVIAVIAIVILSRYRIDRARHEEIVAALVARRAPHGSSSELAAAFADGRAAGG
jgi:Na+/melibiose symporter-like transporter